MATTAPRLPATAAPNRLGVRPVDLFLYAAAAGVFAALALAAGVVWVKSLVGRWRR